MESADVYQGLTIRGSKRKIGFSLLPESVSHSQAKASKQNQFDPNQIKPANPNSPAVGKNINFQYMYYYLFNFSYKDFECQMGPK
jgi:hypothetical protein